LTAAFALLACCSEPRPKGAKVLAPLSIEKAAFPFNSGAAKPAGGDHLHFYIGSKAAKLRRDGRFLIEIDR
jgi:hypothetical protein